MQTTPRTLIECFQQHYPDLLQFLIRQLRDTELAADIAQETYLRLVALGEPKTLIEQPRAFIFRVASNLAIDQQRRESRHSQRRAPEELASSETDRRLCAETIHLARERLNSLDAALAELPTNYSQALMLSRLDGLTYTEIGQQLGVSPSMVAKYIAQALKHCRHSLNILDRPS